MPVAVDFPLHDRISTAGGSLILTKVGNNLVLTKSSGVSGSITIEDIELVSISNSITLGSDNTVDIGTPSVKLRNLYANVLIGDISGNDWIFTNDMFVTITNASDKTLTIRNDGAGNTDLNISDGVLQTGGVQRISNAGALTNITTLALSGAISGGTTISCSSNINTTGGVIQTNSVERISNAGALSNITGVAFTDSSPTVGLTSASNRTINFTNAGVGNLHLDISGGHLYTGGTARVLSTGALSNITTISASGDINTTGGGIQTNTTERISNNGAIKNIPSITFNDAIGYIQFSSASTRPVIIRNVGAGDTYLNLDSGAFRMGGSEVISATKLVKGITGIEFSDANQAIGLSSASQRTFTFENTGAEGLVVKFETDEGVTDRVEIKSSGGVAGEGGLWFSQGATNAFKMWTNSTGAANTSELRFDLITTSDGAITTSLGKWKQSGLDITGAIKSQADNQGLYTGVGDDLRLWHDSSDSFMVNYTGVLVIQNSNSDIYLRTGGTVNIGDTDDSNVNLFALNTSARTLTVGQPADTIATTFYGDTLLDTQKIVRNLVADDTEVTHNTTTPTTKKSARYGVNIALDFKPTFMYVMCEMKVSSGTGGVDIYIDATERITLNTSSASYEMQTSKYELVAADVTDGFHTVEVKLDNDGAGTVSQKLIEIFLM